MTIMNDGACFEVRVGGFFGYGKATTWNERDCGERDLHGDDDLWDAGGEGRELSYHE